MENQTELSNIESNQKVNVNTLADEETLNNEPEIIEPKLIPNPWDNAPIGVVFYDTIHENGRLGTNTQSAEMAYKLGFNIDHDYISIDDVQRSDLDGGLYIKDLCPMKTQSDIDRENAIQEITQLKKALSDTDYKAIKYAEGEINPEEYLPIKNQRAEWRAKINQLQAEFDI